MEMGAYSGHYTILPKPEVQLAEADGALTKANNALDNIS